MNMPVAPGTVSIPATYSFLWDSSEDFAIITGGDSTKYGAFVTGDKRNTRLPQREHIPSAHDAALRNKEEKHG